MKIPLSWLKEYVEFDLEPKELAERLTFIGLEVESLDVVGSDFAGLVAGEVLKIQPHPDADNLLLCDVSNGTQTLRVVCGARNFGVGDKVPLAGIGATLPNGITITPAVVRGETSQGMLCAEDELGLSDDHTGLLILPRETPAGTALAKIIGPPEMVLTLEITPNRPDCLSLIGIASEVAALTGRRLKLPLISFPETGPAVDTCASVRVEDAEGCPRYTARILSNVAIAPSPFLARRRLALAGIRPINNIVDVTNYVMLECGQPLHAFDQTLLEEGRIVVRRAKPGERMATLDGAERVLTPDLLVIADARRPVAVAGVMGGAASGILDTTQTVLLESACFKPALIRKGSKLLGLATESSYRFERGVDINLAEWASRRAAGLMIQWSGAAAARGVIDAYPEKPAPREIACRFERVRQLLGVTIADDSIAAIFESLMLPVIQRNGKNCIVQAPTFRPDLEREADLIEEVARMHGLANIPARAPSRGVSLADDSPTHAIMRCRANLIGLGLSEIVNYSFVSDALLSRLDTAGADSRIILPRPMSADFSVLRPWLLPQMVDTLGRNRSRQIAEAAFFEIGRIFYKNPAGTLCEEERLAIGLMGTAGRSGLEKHRPLREDEAFAWLKGILEELCTSLAFPYPAHGEPAGAIGLALSSQAPGTQPPPGFPARCFKDHRLVTISLDGEDCGLLGLVADDIRREYRMLEPVAVLELRLAPLLRHVAKVPVARELPVYPSVTRDIALLVATDIKHETIVQAIRKLSPKELTEIQLFDIYKSAEMGIGFKSMAYSLTYRAADRTLTDSEVNALHESVKAGLRSELKAEIREG
jgi:phenylalanyl-tRNA synthetase beta chain